MGQITYENLVESIAKKIQDSIDKNTKASVDELGLVRIDGKTIAIDTDGAITVSGENVTGLVKTVNNNTPDAKGNVNTAFRIIRTMKMDTDWTDEAYPLGISEFTADYDPANYEDYIKAHPSYEVIPKGKIMVRTYKDTISSPAVVWQFIDSTEDTIFYAQYFRVGNSDGTWGDIGIDNPSHVIHIKKDMSPSAIITDYPRGVSVFDATYDENDLSWYEALGLMDKETYKQDVGSYPKGSMAVTSFRNETLINQIIQMTDEHTGTIGTFTRYYDSEIIPNGWVGGNTLDSGLDGRVRSVNGKTPKVDGGVTLTASDLDTYDKEEIDNKIDNASGSYTLPVATQITLGGVKVDGKTITIVDGVISTSDINTSAEAIPFTTTLSPLTSNTWSYTPSATVKDGDTLLVFYNGGALSRAEYELSPTEPKIITLNVDESPIESYNVITGVIFRGSINGVSPEIPITKTFTTISAENPTYKYIYKPSIPLKLTDNNLDVYNGSSYISSTGYQLVEVDGDVVLIVPSGNSQPIEYNRILGRVYRGFN